MAFGPDTCLHTLDIMGPVGHLAISIRIEIENRLLAGYPLLYAGKKKKKKKKELACSSLLLLSPNMTLQFLQSIFPVLFPFLPIIQAQSSSPLGTSPDIF